MAIHSCGHDNTSAICTDCVNGVGRADGWAPAFGSGSDALSSAGYANAAAAWAGMAADHQLPAASASWGQPAAPVSDPTPYAPRTGGDKAARMVAYSAATLAGLAWMENNARRKYRNERTTWQYDRFGNLIEVHPPDAEVNRWAARQVTLFYWGTFVSVVFMFVFLLLILPAMLGI